MRYDQRDRGGRRHTRRKLCAWECGHYAMQNDNVCARCERDRGRPAWRKTHPDIWRHRNNGGNGRTE